jgi:hypothetical protein
MAWIDWLAFTLLIGLLGINAAAGIAAWRDARRDRRAPIPWVDHPLSPPPRR